MRVFISGGAGCLGSNLAERWLAAGHDVLIFDNFATGQRDGVPSAARLIEGTIADRSGVDRAFDEFRPTHVVHSAASYSDPGNWHEDIATNVTGTINLVGAARRHQVARFINFQTALCYGNVKTFPIPLDHPCRPVTSYGVSKVAGENYVALAGLSYASLRIASVIGPRLLIGVIPTFYSRLKAGKGVYCSTAVRDWLDMEDFFAFMDVAMAADAPTGVFNVGPGVGHSMVDILNNVCAAMGVAVPDPVDLRLVAADDVETVVLDASQAESAFGWKAKVPFARSIERMVRWYDTHGVAAVYSHLQPAAAKA